MLKNLILRPMSVRVVITGMGAVTPLGNDMKATWEALKSGASGVNRITKFDAAAFPCRIERISAITSWRAERNAGSSRVAS